MAYRSQLVETDAAIAFQRERRLRREADGREGERQWMHRQLPTGERARIFEQRLLFFRADVEDHSTAVPTDEMVVPDRTRRLSSTYSFSRSLAARAAIPSGASA